MVCTPRLPLWVFLALLTGVAMLAVSSAVLGIAYISYDAQRAVSTNEISQQLQLRAVDAITVLVDNLQNVATSIPHLEEELAACAMPSDDYAPYALVRLFNAITASGDVVLGSLGIMRPHPTEPQGKLSWQIAAGYGCPGYIYATGELRAYPNVTGHCVPTEDSNLNLTRALSAPAVYRGTDWGLKPDELRLLRGETNRTFMPIGSIIDYQTLTYHQSYWCNGAPYAIVFAEQSLGQLENTLQRIIHNADAPHYEAVFVVERATGLYVAASVDLHALEHGNARFHLTNVTDPLLYAVGHKLWHGGVVTPRGEAENSLRVMGPGGEWMWIRAHPFVTEIDGIDWVVVSVVEPSLFYVALADATTAYIVAIVIAIVVLIAFTALFIKCCISAPFERLTRRASKITQVHEMLRADSDSGASDPHVSLDDDVYGGETSVFSEIHELSRVLRPSDNSATHH